MDINCKNNCGNIVGDWNEECEDCFQFRMAYQKGYDDFWEDNHGN